MAAAAKAGACATLEAGAGLETPVKPEAPAAGNIAVIGAWLSRGRLPPCPGAPPNDDQRTGEKVASAVVSAACWGTAKDVVASCGRGRRSGSGRSNSGGRSSSMGNCFTEALSEMVTPSALSTRPPEVLFWRGARDQAATPAEHTPVSRTILVSVFLSIGYCIHNVRRCRWQESESYNFPPCCYRQVTSLSSARRAWSRRQVSPNCHVIAAALLLIVGQ